MGKVLRSSVASAEVMFCWINTWPDVLLSKRLQLSVSFHRERRMPSKPLVGLGPTESVCCNGEEVLLATFLLPRN